MYIRQKRMSHTETKKNPMKSIQIIQKVDATDDDRPQDQPLQGLLLK